MSAIPDQPNRSIQNNERKHDTENPGFGRLQSGLKIRYEHRADIHLAFLQLVPANSVPIIQGGPPLRTVAVGDFALDDGGAKQALKVVIGDGHEIRSLTEGEELLGGGQADPALRMPASALVDENPKSNLR